MYICQSQPPNLSQLPLPSCCPYICSLHLCLYFCFANKTIYTTFLDSTYILVQSLSCVWLFATSWTTACQDSLSIINSQSPPKPMSIVSVMPSNHLILCHPLSSRLQSCPASGAFPLSWLFVSDGQSIELLPQHQYFQWMFRVDFL